MYFNKLFEAAKSQGLLLKDFDQLVNHPSPLEGQITPTASERSTSSLLGSSTLEDIIPIAARTKRKMDPQRIKQKKKKTVPQVVTKTEEEEEEEDPLTLEI